MGKESKNRVKALAVVDAARKYSVEEAMALVKKAKFAKFDETVDLAVRLGLNPKHADQMVRGAIVLPHGTGQTLRVLVFAKGEKEKEAKEAGADFTGAADSFRRALAHDPERADARLRLPHLLVFRLREPREAAAHYEFLQTR